MLLTQHFFNENCRIGPCIAELHPWMHWLHDAYILKNLICALTFTMHLKCWCLGGGTVGPSSVMAETETAKSTLALKTLKLALRGEELIFIITVHDDTSHFAGTLS